MAGTGQRSVCALATVAAMISVVRPCASFLTRGAGSVVGVGRRWTSSSSSASFSSSALFLEQSDLYTETPLILSEPMTALFAEDGHPNVSVYLKMDCAQRSGSFKDRGMARLCRHLCLERGVRRLVSSSGGNAGLAVATVASRLEGVEVTVVVPGSTKPIVIDRLRSLGAEVVVEGAVWNEADAAARRAVEASDGAAAYVSPYDDPLLWEGHATLVPEIVAGLPPSAALSTLVVSVGGGGLLCGALGGLRDVGRDDVAVVAAETEGADCHARAVAAGGVPVALETISSVATSLGALEVTAEALRRAADRAGPVRPSVCGDAEAVAACVAFANDHRVLVEPACGAALATVYSTRLRRALFAEATTNADEQRHAAVVIEVCGGSGVNLELLNGWKEQFGV